MDEIRSIRVEPVACPKCGSVITRIINQTDLICVACGQWSNPMDSPSVKAAQNGLKPSEKGKK